MPVDVSQGAESTSVPGGYTYYQRLELVAVLPEQGSVSGSTQITLTGAGFGPGVRVYLGEQQLEDAQVLNDSTILATSPQHPWASGCDC